MKAVIFGASGQLGKEICQRMARLPDNFSVITPTRSDVDITDESRLSEYLVSASPDVIINSAAYTAVDKAEEDQENAYQINALVPGYLADAAKKIDSFLVHISTDYVFSGLGDSPLTEKDSVDPKNVYGKTKLEGEQNVIAKLPSDQFSILRTASVHGKYGQNFVHTMLKLFNEKAFLDVVADQWMSPTWAGFLADAVIEATQRRHSGLFHCSSNNGASWFELAQEIERKTSQTRNNVCVVQQTTADKFKRPAARPRYSVFNTTKMQNTFALAVPTWQDGLSKHLGEIL